MIAHPTDYAEEVEVVAALRQANSDPLIFALLLGYWFGDPGLHLGAWHTRKISLFDVVEAHVFDLVCRERGLGRPSRIRPRLLSWSILILLRAGSLIAWRELWLLASAQGLRLSMAWPLVCGQICGRDLWDEFFQADHALVVRLKIIKILHVNICLRLLALQSPYRRSLRAELQPLISIHALRVHVVGVKQRTRAPELAGVRSRLRPHNPALAQQVQPHLLNEHCLPVFALPAHLVPRLVRIGASELEHVEFVNQIYEEEHEDWADDEANVHQRLVLAPEVVSRAEES